MVKEIIEEISLPEGANIAAKKDEVEITLNGKTIKKKFNSGRIELEVKNGKLIIKVKEHKRRGLALMNTVKKIIKNIEIGLTKGYEYKLSVVYTHFPMTVKVQNKVLEIGNFTGEKTIRRAKILGDTKVTVKGKEVVVEGVNKEDVSLTASNIENISKVRGKDIRVFQDGIYITKKGEKDASN